MRIEPFGPRIYVELPPEDRDWYTSVARKNANDNPRDNRNLDAVTPEQSAYIWTARGAELAVARAGNLTWTGSIEEDVPPYQIKAVDAERNVLFIPKHKDNCVCKECRQAENPEQIFISVRVVSPTYFCIRGWLRVKELKQYPLGPFPGQKDGERNPVWKAPNENLHPMWELPEFKWVFSKKLHSL